jgi:hypothetical protein
VKQSRRKCAICKMPEQRWPMKPQNSLTRVCSIGCALAKARADEAVKARKVAAAAAKQNRADRERIKTLAQWTKEAQAAVNAWVRLRDEVAGLPCISCQRHHQGQWHAGHYRSTAAAPHLRFDTDRNIWRQCSVCNLHLSANLINYRASLIKMIGIKAVESLENDNTVRKYSKDDLRQIRDDYRRKYRELKKKNESQINSG